ncbi:MAG: hypothetical protein IKP88_10515 [Lachnospiraceae bacterium]|nr:hypothetical protein [Lachnospiraceae bacterium]
MKNGWNKKALIIKCILLTVIFTAFLPWNMPKLINADKPFIDLAGSVGDSIGNAKAAYEKATMVAVPTDSPSPTDQPVPTDAPEVTDTPEIKPDKTEVRIMVGDENPAGAGEKISVNDYDIGSVEKLAELIEDQQYEGKSFVIVDNYAETKTYRAVAEILEEHGKSFSKETVEAN